MIKSLQVIQEKEIKNVSNFSIIRKHIEELRYDKNCIILLGPQGVGKTTLLLQYASEFQPEECLYFNASLESVIGEGFDSIVTEFYTAGGKIVIIDDIHKHPKWEEKLKKILTKCKNLKIVVSGPILLKNIISKIKFNKKNMFFIILKELSFRLFLAFKYFKVFEPLLLEEILNDSEMISVTIADKIPNLHLDFDEYLNHGCYPVFVSDKYNERAIFSLIDKAIYEDIPAVNKIKFENLSIFKKFIYKLLLSNGILKINVDKLAREFNISEPTLYIYLDIIENSGIFYPVKNHMSITGRKPERIFFHNPNILNLYSKLYSFNTDWYIMKKTFFISNFDEIYYVNEKKFKYKNYIFNFFDQEKFTFYITDEIISQNPNHIPIWLFGFLN